MVTGVQKILDWHASVIPHNFSNGIVCFYPLCLTCVCPNCVSPNCVSLVFNLTLFILIFMCVSQCVCCLIVSHTETHRYIHIHTVAGSFDGFVLVVFHLSVFPLYLT